MTVRKIAPEERIMASRVQSTAFNFGADFSADKDFTEGYELIRAAFNDEGKLCSCIEVIPFETSFNGATVKMAGIGGVASLPEERGLHGVQKIFEAAFAEMRGNGQWLSYLYPFSHAYYRKYGYELTMRKLEYTIPVASFSRFAHTGSVKSWQPGSDDADIRRVFDAFAQGNNFTVLRDEKLWKKHLGDDPYKNNTYTYVYYGEDGAPAAYINFTAKKCEPFRCDMQVNELFWSDVQGLLGIFAFVGCFTSQYNNFIWLAPHYLDLRAIFSEAYAIRAEIKTGGMSRVVDVEQLLRVTPAPAGEGKIAIRVTDSFLEWNNGTFAVSWNNGRLSVSREDCAPDLTCTVQQFARLLSGFAPAEDCLYTGALQIHGSREMIDRFFPKKKLYICEAF